MYYTGENYFVIKKQFKKKTLSKKMSSLIYGLRNMNELSVSSL